MQTARHKPVKVQHGKYGLQASDLANLVDDDECDVDQLDCRTMPGTPPDAQQESRESAPTIPGFLRPCFVRHNPTMPEVVRLAWGLS